jgi:LL-diaminopimelate aminotransferase
LNQNVLITESDCRVKAPSTRLSSLPVYAFEIIAQRIQAMVARGEYIIRLDIGSPDMPPPAEVIEALAVSARDPHHHGYAGYRGTPNFRRAIAQYYEARFGVEVDANTQVLPVLGSKEGIVNLSLAYLNPGDVALVPDIGYPSYSMGAYLAGADVHWLPMREESGYIPDLENIPTDALQRAKILWINYPNNPTGATVDLAFYERCVQFCLAHDLLLACDNPYVEVTFNGYVADSALQIDGANECVVEFTSLSKSHNMAGWRLGAAVGAPAAIKNLLQVKSNVDSGHFVPIYDAGALALTTTPSSWIAERNAIYQRRRDRVIECLPTIGLRAHVPKGSLYIWAETAFGDGVRYCSEALEEAHVSLAPGEIYGPGGKKYVRISVGVSDEDLSRALDRLQQWYEKKYA